MNHTLVEICCGSADDVFQAYQAGADRVELNSNLFQGGLTPTLAELTVAKKVTKNNIPIITMIRPRSGGFHYTDLEYKTAIEDAKFLLNHGADGLAFGFLNNDGSIDKIRTREFVDLTGNKDKVFHRAIDVVPDWKEAIDFLIDTGITRILTSGGEKNALFGAPTIKEMISYANGNIEILAGAGINLKNMDRIISETGCTQIHLSSSSTQFDPSARATGSDIYFGGALYPPEDTYNMVDASNIKKIVTKTRTIY